MHDRIRRAICRFFFLFLVLLPTLVVAGWSIYANSGPGVESRREGWEQRLELLLGTRVTIGSVRPVFPGTVEFKQLQLSLPGDEQPMVTIGQLQLTRGELRRLQLEKVHVDADQLGYWVDWLEQTTRQLSDDLQLRLVIKQLVFDHGPYQDSFAEVVGVLDGSDDGSQAIINLWQESSQGDPLALQLIHQPEEKGRYRWILQTGSSPLPTRLLASQLSPLSRLGTQSLFDGQLTCVRGGQPGRVELVGQFQEVDLESLSGFPASGMLAGSGQLEVRRCRVLDGACQFLDVVLRSDGGSVDTGWLQATAQRWDAMLPQGAGARQAFTDLSCHLELDGNGIRIRGREEGPGRGALLRQADRVLLAQPRVEWLSVAQLVEVLVPASQERLPATRHTARLLRAIELPHLR